MNLDRRRSFAIVGILATSLSSVVLAVVAMSGFQTSGGGDVPVSLELDAGLGLALVLFGALAVAGVVLGRATRRRPRDDRPTLASTPAHP